MLYDELYNHQSMTNMNTGNRTCATCAAFNPGHSDGQPACWNMIAFIAHPDSPPELARDPEPDDFCEEHCTPDDEGGKKAATARYVADSTPEFLTAMQECLRLIETLGIEHPDASRAMRLAIQLAPDSLTGHMALRANETELLPEPDGYTYDGQPVYSLASTAAILGVSMDEAQTVIDEFLETHSESELSTFLVDPAKIHRTQ